MITKEEFENIATLARLAKDDEAYSRLSEDLSSMIAFSRKIGEVSLEESNCIFEEFGASDLREDIVEASFEREEILSNAPMSQDGFFLLRKRA